MATDEMITKHTQSITVININDQMTIVHQRDNNMGMV